MQGYKQRYDEAGDKGLKVGFLESIAALDRLGRFCFTGEAKALMPSVMQNLQTIDSLRSGGWPYIDPDKLNIQRGKISSEDWPRLPDWQPLLMHTRTLEYYYGKKVAENHRRHLFFQSFQGKDKLLSPDKRFEFFTTFLQTRWQPQMVGWLREKFVRGLNEVRKGAAAHWISNDDLEKHRDAIRQWTDSDFPFRSE